MFIAKCIVFFFPDEIDDNNIIVVEFVSPDVILSGLKASAN